MEKLINLQVGLNKDQIEYLFKTSGIEFSIENLEKLQSICENVVFLGPALESCLEIFVEDFIVEEWG